MAANIGEIKTNPENSDIDDIENNLEENLKYVQVLKRYFGYAKFRK